MKATNECFECFKKQILNTHALLDELGVKLDRCDTFGLTSYFSYNLTPPEIAANIYKEIKQKSQIVDIYKHKKEESIKRAKEMIKSIKQRFKDAEDRLYFATKMAVLGNVIDYGTSHSFDLEKEFETIFNASFGVNHFLDLKKELFNASSIVYIGDNAGENLFDELLIEEIKEFNPKVKIYYFVRSEPIINDITLLDLDGSNMHNLCEIIESGSNAPAFLLNKATLRAKELFLSSDLIISKGMGNFEALSELDDKRIFFIFKIKCDVVANHLKKPLGTIMLMQNSKER